MRPPPKRPPPAHLSPAPPAGASPGGVREAAGRPASTRPASTRPASIRAFEALILASLAIGLVVTALTWDRLTEGVGAGPVVLVQAATVAAVLGGVVLVARRASNIARWAVTVMFAIGFVAYIPQVAFLFSGEPLVGTLGAVQVMLQLSAVLMLFRPDARAWFRARGRPGLTGEAAGGATGEAAGEAARIAGRMTG